MGTRTKLRIQLLGLAALIFFWAPRPGLAHKLAVKRTLMLEPSGVRDLQVLIQLRVPSGAPRRALSALADSDRDGRIDASEEKNMRRMLAVRALDGVKMVAGSSTVSIENVKTKLKVEGEEGPVDLVVHGVASLPDRPRDLVLVLTTAVDGDPVDLIVLPGNRPVVDTDRGAASGGGMKASLGQGDRVRIRLADVSK